MTKKLIKFFILFICIVSFICLSCFIFYIRHPYGYFVKGPSMNYEHSEAASMLELGNGNILILGENLPDSNIPSEIYDIKKNKFIISDLINDKDIYYYPVGILLDDNKLLLTYVNNTGNAEDKKTYFYPKKYNLMAIVNLDTHKVENYIHKNMTPIYRPDQFIRYTKLGNGNIIIMDLKEKVAEIYNPKNNSSRVLHLNYKLGSNDEIVPVGLNKVLVFGGYWQNEKTYKLNEVIIYKDNDLEIISVGNVLPRECSFISKISENKIIIAGGVSGQMSDYYTQEIEIYDVNTNKSDVIGKFTQHRQTRPIYYPEYSGIKLSDRYFMTAGGNGALGSFGYDLKSTDIVDLVNKTITKGPDMIYQTTDFKMIKLVTGDVLCIFKGISQEIPYRRKTQIFKLKNRRIKL